jgi:hypothetical protein
MRSLLIYCSIRVVVRGGDFMASSSSGRPFTYSTTPRKSTHKRHGRRVSGKVCGDEIAWNYNF